MTLSSLPYVQLHVHYIHWWIFTMLGPFVEPLDVVVQVSGYYIMFRYKHMVESLVVGLDTSCFYFCLFFYSLMLSSHAYYGFEVNLLFSNYAEKMFSTQTKYLIFFVCTCSEWRPTRNYNVFMWRRV